MGNYFAHSRNGQDGDGVWESVHDHLAAVANTASGYAAAWDGAEQAYMAGLLHDLGKYSDQFQRRLSVPGTQGRDHWTLGAIAALASQTPYSLLPAIAILGHHVGLEELSASDSLAKELRNQLETEEERFTTIDAKSALSYFKRDGFAMKRFLNGLAPRGDYAGDMLDARMLFSALVDADFVETEAHFNGDASVTRRKRDAGPDLDIDQSIAAFDQYMSRFSAQDEQPLTSLRRQLLASACQAGEEPPGNFMLSAPTGSGKTLAMLGFALHHARRWNLRRIVLVMPFLNIIDQTAAIYREIFPEALFGTDFVLEAHSMAGEGDIGHQTEASSWSDSVDKRSIRRRTLAENWDAPIVLTTNVQILESMFANKPSRCRKLHRLARSVILFDEVQTLPPKLATVTLAALSRLCAEDGPFGSTIVFATATQPAFDVLSPRLARLTCPDTFRAQAPAWQPREVVTDAESMFRRTAGRVSVRWRDDRPISFDVLADELMHSSQVLCIVNLKRHAIDLAERLRDRGAQVLHLSTNMCSRHRLEVLSEVKTRLLGRQPLKLVATQCIEAGVDLDFPAVFRALAPLDAIAQAAGRCNRGGHRSESILTVFLPIDEDEAGRQRRIYPPGYDAAVQATQLLLSRVRAEASEELAGIIHSPNRLREYFRLLYSVTGRDQSGGDDSSDEKELLAALRTGRFADIARYYRLIHEDAINILVPFDRHGYQELIQAANEGGRLTARQVRRWERIARPYSVSVYRPNRNDSELYPKLLPIHFGLGDQENRGLETDGIAWWYPALGDGYDPDVGLKLGESQWVM